MYEWAVRVWLKPDLGSTTLEDLDTPIIRRYYGRVLNGPRRDGKKGNVSSSTVRRIHATLHRALEYAVDMRYLPRNPSDRTDPPADRNPKIKCWTPEEVDTFLNATRDHDDWPIWVLALNTGLREAEVAGLRWGDVRGSTVTIERQICAYVGEELQAKEKTKSRAGMRILPLTPDAQEALRIQETHQKVQKLAAGQGWQDAGYIFTTATGGPMHPNGIAKRFKRAVSKVAGVTSITFHKLRHTCVTRMLAQSTDLKTVAYVVGHADPGFTARRYGEVQQHMIDRAAQALQTRISHPA
jgi:integrase